MGFKNPAMVGEQSFERVSEEVDEEQPQSSGKQDGAQHHSGLHWHIGSVCEGTTLLLLCCQNNRNQTEQNTMNVDLTPSAAREGLPPVW